MQFQLSEPTAAGIVAFNPDIDIIVPLARTILSDVEHIVIFVNAVIDDQVLTQLQQLGDKCRIIRSDYNLGVAEALNVITLHAALNGCTRVVLFDQDSRPPTGMIPALNAAMDRLVATGKQIAAVGPAIVAPRGHSKEFKSPRYFRHSAAEPVGNAVPVHYIITSGTLLNIKSFLDVGTFRSDFFIDAIDTEWCFRAWATGYSCWYLTDLPMEHTIGEGTVRSRLFRIRFPHQSRMRIYSYFRNQIVSLTLPHIPLIWKAKFGVHLTRLALAMTLHARFSSSMIGLIWQAMRDGLGGRLGPPPGAAHTVTLADGPQATTKG